MSSAITRLHVPVDIQVECVTSDGVRIALNATDGAAVVEVYRAISVALGLQDRRPIWTVRTSERIFHDHPDGTLEMVRCPNYPTCVDISAQAYFDALRRALQ